MSNRSYYTKAWCERKFTIHTNASEPHYISLHSHWLWRRFHYRNKKRTKPPEWTSLQSKQTYLKLNEQYFLSGDETYCVKLLFTTICFAVQPYSSLIAALMLSRPWGVWYWYKSSETHSSGSPYLMLAQNCKVIAFTVVWIHSKYSQDKGPETERWVLIKCLRRYWF